MSSSLERGLAVTDSDVSETVCVAGGPSSAALQRSTSALGYHAYLRWLREVEVQGNLRQWLNTVGLQIYGGRRPIYVASPRPGSRAARAAPRREGLCRHYLRRFWQWIVSTVCCRREPHRAARRCERPPPVFRDIKETQRVPESQGENPAHIESLISELIAEGDVVSAVRVGGVRRVPSATGVSPSSSPLPLSLTREQLYKILSENEQVVIDYVMEKCPLKMAENSHSKLEDMFALNDVLPEDEEIAFFNQARVDFLNNFSQLSGEPSENQFTVVFAKYLMKVFESTACRIWKMEVGKNKNMLNVELLIKKTDDMLTLMKYTPHKDVIEAARRSRCAISGRSEEISLEEQDHCTGLFYSNPIKRVNLTQAMLVPLLVSSGDTLYVIELYRENLYSLLELQIADSCCVWGSMALFYCMGMVDKTLQYELTVNLIATLKCVFQEMLSLDVVIQRILKFVQQLVNADRASLFMLDRAKNELVSTVFDQKLDGDSREKREIRIPMDRGIAGLVATTGELMNIPDAYKDDRFNREIDESTGYKTTSILCMPVKVDGEIIGVVQMVNKRNASCFYRNDIYAFDVFESFFGLALHHAKLYETIVRNEQKYKVALEVLSYHNTCKDHEVKDLLALEPHKLDHILDDYYLDPYSLNAKKKCQAVIIMFDDLFGMTQFDSMALTRFTLTVMKNYRNVPYHNFDHGWAVAQTIYAILKNDSDGHFNNKQRLALFVASLCHDLDHRGYTNKYMNETESPLAAMYTTSTLEHHHFNTTVRILQQEGHNIFSKFNGEEYKEILSLIRVCILATDLAVFYQNMYDVRKILFIQQRFDWSSLMMQEYAMALSMTAADLSASAKPWDVQIKTVLVIIEEFYTQGDKERAAGRAPIAMMDRTRPEELPISQVGFLTTTCIPCYKMLKYILPGTINLYNMAEKNLKFWEEKVKEKEK